VRRRFGYRRLQVLLQREAGRSTTNASPAIREEKLSCGRKRGRKRLNRAPAASATVMANQVWSLDFMTDALSSGRRFRTLNIVDDYTRECWPSK